MHKIKEVIRLKSARLPLRLIADAVKLSLGAVVKYAKAAEQAGLSWPLPADLSDDALKRRLFGGVAESTPPSRYILPDCAVIHQELKRKGVTLQLLWHEYRAEHGTTAYGYSQFCTLYRRFSKALKRSMRQTHLTGEIRQAQIFVGVLGASNYTYAEATWSQQLPDWLGSHVRMLEFFGGAAAIVVPDNLKSGVDRACRYEPEINRSYADLAAHYGMAVIPARPYKPQDKAKVEVGVQIVERWILAALRRHTFFSLQEVNLAISQLLVQLNAKPFKKLPGCRQSAFELLDKPMLRSLPAHRYEYGIWKKARVNIDYHIEFDGHYYSVPHALSAVKSSCAYDGGRAHAEVTSCAPALDTWQIVELGGIDRAVHPRCRAVPTDAQGSSGNGLPHLPGIAVLGGSMVASGWKRPENVPWRSIHPIARACCPFCRRDWIKHPCRSNLTCQTPSHRHTTTYVVLSITTDFQLHPTTP